MWRSTLTATECLGILFQDTWNSSRASAFKSLSWKGSVLLPGCRCTHTNIVWITKRKKFIPVMHKHHKRWAKWDKNFFILRNVLATKDNTFFSVVVVSRKYITNSYTMKFCSVRKKAKVENNYWLHATFPGFILKYWGLHKFKKLAQIFDFTFNCLLSVRNTGGFVNSLSIRTKIQETHRTVSVFHCMVIS